MKIIKTNTDIIILCEILCPNKQNETVCYSDISLTACDS